MGKVVVKAKLTNLIDSGIANRGFIPKDQIRSKVVEGIVDTGAVMMSLPSDLVEELGLEITGERKVRFADNRISKIPVAGGIKIEIQGRDAQVSALVNGPGSPILIGQIPLEEMDWAVHPSEQRLIPGHEGEYEMPLIEMY